MSTRHTDVIFLKLPGYLSTFWMDTCSIINIIHQASTAFHSSHQGMHPAVVYNQFRLL